MNVIFTSGTYLVIAIIIRIFFNVLPVRRISFWFHLRIFGVFPDPIWVGSYYQFQIWPGSTIALGDFNLTCRIGWKESRKEGCRPSEIESMFWRKRWRKEKKWEERKMRTKTDERKKRKIKKRKELSEGYASA